MQYCSRPLFSFEFIYAWKITFEKFRRRCIELSIHVTGHRLATCLEGGFFALKGMCSQHTHHWIRIEKCAHTHLNADSH